MPDQPSVRSFESDDTEQALAIAESSMTSSYALSPNDIETILEDEFTNERLHERLEDSTVEIYVAEIDGVLAGFVETSLDEGEE